MTSSALITMLIAWIAITGFALRFLFKVIRTPLKKDEPDQSEEVEQGQ